MKTINVWIARDTCKHGKIKKTYLFLIKPFWNGVQWVDGRDNPNGIDVSGRFSIKPVECKKAEVILNEDLGVMSDEINELSFELRRERLSG